MKKFKTIWTIVFICTLILTLPAAVYADIGPKDELTVYVNHPPKELYYLDLLTQETSPYNNLSDEGERESLNSTMVDLLYSYANEGWKPALTEGTGVPMFGNLIGEPDGNRMVHEFGYFGVPDTYRIIIVTESGEITVSDTFTRKALQSSITFDYNSGKAVVPNIAYTYLLQFITTCIPTLIIEAILLLLFGFKLKENWKVFLFANIITQIALTIIIGSALIKSGPLSAYITQFPIEVAILAFESILYYKFLKGKTPKTRCIYGIVANLASWAIGFFLLSYQYELLIRLL
ncbi:hypothetical protein [Anaerovorax sp. IOR16]|uniref:hypothetical protein n=1 Tax=Anaerovorax sp. IOR16 TaxID=2773458 RepID=UPI0019D1DA9B|nr:hypothetical protein [Anaerovorax sp. IOR16]